jgi:EpsI family protein
VISTLKNNSQKRFKGLVVFIAILTLLAGGAGYRISSIRLARITGTKIVLDHPLNEFSTKVMDWRGEDSPIPVNIQRVAGADDFLSRIYTNEKDKMWVHLYVAYTARPRTMLGHQPRICYPASGWIHDKTDRIEIITDTGRHIPCLLHYFHKPGQDQEQRVVLNYYIVNGRLTNDESVFSGFGWRTPNIAGSPARYVAQVQISSLLENSVRQAAQDMSEKLIVLLPDDKGIVNIKPQPDN